MYLERTKCTYMCPYICNGWALWLRRKEVLVGVDVGVVGS